MSFDNDILVTMTTFVLAANFATDFSDHTEFRTIQALEKIGPDHSLRPFLPNNSRSFAFSCLSVLTLGRHIGLSFANCPHIKNTARVSSLEILGLLESSSEF